MTFEAHEHNEEDLGMLDSYSVARKTPWPGIPHYYGNVARQLLVGGAVLMLITSPLYGGNLSVEFIFLLVGAVAAVGAAALTNPKIQWTAVLDAVVSGAGAVVFGGWGILEYQSITLIAFVLRICIALVFLLAFYFSMKTVRSFILHMIGRRETVDEFESDAERAEDAKLEAEERTEARESSRGHMRDDSGPIMRLRAEPKVQHSNEDWGARIREDERKSRDTNDNIWGGRA